MEESIIFSEEKRQVIKVILAQVLTGRGGRVVEDISKEINEKMFPLTERQIKDVDSVVEAFVYGGGVQEELSFPERLQSGLDYIMQKLLQENE